MRRCFAAALLTALATASPAGAATTAVTGTSAAFGDSVGVAIHEFYPDTLYGDKTLLKSMLQDLGVRHVRDGIGLHREEYQTEYPSARDLASAGIKFQWVVGEPGNSNVPQHADDAFAILTDPNRLGGTAEEFEGPNEYDGHRGTDALWSTKLLTYQGEFYERFKNDSRFGAMPFYGPSFMRTEGRQDYAKLKASSVFMDAPNAHVYAAGLEPESVLDGEITAVTHDFSATRQPVISETGYHTALNDVVEPGHPATSERAQSIYLLRTLLWAFRMGIPRTYIYQLLDQKPETALRNLQEHFGLVAIDGGDPSAPQSTWTVRKKPAFNSIAELLRIERDTGTDARPQALDYSLPGAPATVRSVLLSHSGGIVDLVLWNQVPVWNRTTKTDLFPADVAVTLNLGEPADVSTERPHSQTSFTALGHGTSFGLSVGADPVVVRVKLPKYATEVRNDAPSAWLRLSEASGTATDSAGRGATVDPWSAAPTYGQASAVGDADDRSVGIAPGQQATLRLPSGGAVNTKNGAAVELWVKPATTVPDWAHFLTAGLGDWTVSMRVYQPHDGRWWGSAYGSKFGHEMVFDGFGYGSWHHLVLSMAGGVSTTYVDGRRAGELGGDDELSLSSFQFGGRAGSGGFAGSLDELAVYPHALSAARVCAHYRAAGGSC